MKNSMDRLQELIELAGLKARPDIQALLNVVAVSGDPQWEQVLLEITEPLAAMREQMHEFPGPEPGALPTEGICLGNVCYMDGSRGEEVRIPLEDFLTHMFISGTVGAGKSHLIAGIAHQLMTLGAPVPVWIFDIQQAEFARKLVPLHGSDRLRVFDVSSFRRNPLEPLGSETPMATLQRFSDLLFELLIGPGGSNMARSILIDLYSDLGVFDGTRDYPSMEMFLERLAKLRFRTTSRNAWYWEVLTNRLAHVVDYIPAYKCKRGFDLKELMSRSAIFRLDGLSHTFADFFIRDLASAAAELLAQERAVDNGLKLLLVFDESHRWLGREKSARLDGAEPTLIRLAREVRKNGLGLIFSDHSPSLTVTQIMSVTNIKLNLRLGTGACAQTVGAATGMQPSQAATLTELPFRIAAIHAPVLGYLRPFAMEVAEFSFEEDPNAVEIRMAESLTGLEYEPSETSMAKRGDAAPRAREPEPEAGAEPLSKSSTDYLALLANHPPRPVTDFDRAVARVSLYKGNTNRAELLRHEYIRLKKVNSGIRGGQIVLAEVTQRGYDHLASIRVQVSKARGRGDVVHRFLAHTIAEALSMRYPEAKVRIEDGSRDKYVDVSFEHQGRRTAIEVVHLGLSKEVVNLAKDVADAGYDEVMFVCENRQIAEELNALIRRELGSEVLAKVEFRIYRDFLTRWVRKSQT